MVYLSFFLIIIFVKSKYCRSQWQRGLRHELSSLVQTLGSWVRILIEAWMPVCVYSMFALSCVYVLALQRADHSSTKSYRLCIDQGIEKAAGQGPQGQ
jgi:hypothetical protein